MEHHTALRQRLARALAPALIIALAGCALVVTRSPRAQPAAPAGPTVTALRGLADGQALSGKVVVEALTSGADVKEVVFALDGPTPARHIERRAPWYFMGDSGGVPWGWDTRKVADGAYTMTITATDSAGRRGARQVRFSIANAAPARPTLAPPTTVPPTAVPPTAVPPAAPAGAAPAGGDHAFPLGQAAGYGWISCGLLPGADDCVNNGYTLVHAGYSRGFDPTYYARLAQQYHARGVLRSFIPYVGRRPDSELANAAYYDTQLRAFRDQLGPLADQIRLFYVVDEPATRALRADLADARAALRAYFPKARVLSSGVEAYWRYPNRHTFFVESVDIYAVQAYPVAHGEPIGVIYQQFRMAVPPLAPLGKVAYQILEGFGTRCTGDPQLAPDAYPAERAYARTVNEIMQGVAGGAQGVLSYWYGEGTAQYVTPPGVNTPCAQAQRYFYPRYRELWPWIMRGERVQLGVSVTSGPAGGESMNWGPFPSVVAWQFTDASGKKIIVAPSLMDYSNAGGQSTRAAITGVAGGTWDVLWENRAVTVSDGRITDTWAPYGYHVYRQR